ncbi:MAG TPA: hypothetical protein PLU85_01460 [Bacteroidia bacterium]|nr:hypothetical protein [Bacteroidia bacterium]MBP7715277.1 hypothetical protein [Bacteroidia bacterium]MBP8669264.1 hypothetical protein [Bacteroidia bacterium]HOZ90662.1 hypothetical protein [Bacteroidia bacterium]HQW18759.1 hypothetical protein [Bacteroidia bacterium]
MLRKVIVVSLICAGSLFLLLYFTSLFSISELIYPNRITVKSLTAEFHNLKKDELVIDKDVIVSPSQLNLNYRNFDVAIHDHFTLHGWYISGEQPATTTVLLLHDWNESKLSMIKTAEALYQLGFNVCVVDLPAHGESDGEKFIIDQSMNHCLEVVADSLYCLYETDNIAVVAYGLSGIIAASWIKVDSRSHCMILVDPVPGMIAKINELVKEKWNGFSMLVTPFAQIKYRQKTGIDADSLNLQEYLGHLRTPLLVAISDSATDLEIIQSVRIFEEAKSPNKKIWTNQTRSFIRIDTDAEKNMYRAMAAFINSNISSEKPKIKVRKRIAAL